MSTVHLPRRRAAARAGLVSLAAVAASSMGLSTATAAPALVIPLDPPELVVSPVPIENFGATDLVSDPGTGELQPVPAQYAGTVEIDLPGDLDATDGVVTLDLAPDLESEPTLSYGSGDLGSPLVFATDADGDPTVTLPGNDGSNGPIGLLTVDGITSGADGVQVAPVQYAIELLDASDPSADPTAQVAPQLLALSTVPCALTSVDPCPAYTAQAGSSITFSVPGNSLLTGFGLGTLENLHVALGAVDGGTAPIELSSQPVAAATGGDTAAPTDQSPADELAGAQELAAAVGDPLDGDVQLPVAAATSGAEPTATVTLPADLPAGDYAVDVLEGNAAVGVSVTTALLHVEAAPAAAAAAATTPPVQQNAGLRSDTGWIEPAEDGGPSALVLIGGGTLLVATVGIVTVLRPRRRGAGS